MKKNLKLAIHLISIAGLSFAVFTDSLVSKITGRTEGDEGKSIDGLPFGTGIDYAYADIPVGGGPGGGDDDCEGEGEGGGEGDC